MTPLFRDDPDLALRVLTTGMPEAAYGNLRRIARSFPRSTAVVARDLSSPPRRLGRGQARQNRTHG
jgi:hypothetical protein